MFQQVPCIIFKKSKTKNPNYLKTCFKMSKLNYVTLTKCGYQVTCILLEH